MQYCVTDHIKVNNFNICFVCNLLFVNHVKQNKPIRTLEGDREIDLYCSISSTKRASFPWRESVNGKWHECWCTIKECEENLKTFVPLLGPHMIRWGKSSAHVSISLPTTMSTRDLVPRNAKERWIMDLNSNCRR